MVNRQGLRPLAVDKQVRKRLSVTGSAVNHLKKECGIGKKEAAPLKKGDIEKYGAASEGIGL